jgi:hypothetical protein
MRINQIMEADSGLAKQSANIARLERAGGSLYADDATKVFTLSCIPMVLLIVLSVRQL